MTAWHSMIRKEILEAKTLWPKGRNPRPNKTGMSTSRKWRKFNTNHPNSEILLMRDGIRDGITNTKKVFDFLIVIIQESFSCQTIPVVHTTKQWYHRTSLKHERLNASWV